MMTTRGSEFLCRCCRTAIHGSPWLYLQLPGTDRRTAAAVAVSIYRMSVQYRQLTGHHSRAAHTMQHSTVCLSCTARYFTLFQPQLQPTSNAAGKVNTYNFARLFHCTLHLCLLWGLMKAKLRPKKSMQEKKEQRGGIMGHSFREFFSTPGAAPS